MAILNKPLLSPRRCRRPRGALAVSAFFFALTESGTSFASPEGLRAEQHLPVEARRGNHWFIGSRDLVICSHLVMAKMGWNDDWLVVWNMAELFSISYMGCHPSH